MKRSILLSVGWLGTGAWLYLGLAMLEFYWNCFDWQPRSNAISVALLLGICGGIAGIWLLAGAVHDRSSRAVSLIVCLGLLGLAVYLFPAETVSQGLFAREVPSPLWYRGGRFVLMSLPIACWAVRPQIRTPRGISLRC